MEVNVSSPQHYLWHVAVVGFIRATLQVLDPTAELPALPTSYSNGRNWSKKTDEDNQARHQTCAEVCNLEMRQYHITKIYNS
eukprot:4946038-Amphidinium_carterae.2